MRLLKTALLFIVPLGLVICPHVYGLENASSVQFMSLLEYRQEILAVKGETDEQCPMNLRVRPRHRQLVLQGGHSYDWLVNEKNYSANQRKLDEKWASSLQDSMRKERSVFEIKIGVLTPAESPWVSHTDKNLDRLYGYRFYPGFYPVENFASYQVGTPRMPWGKDRGFTFKVFFEFKNPQKDLTPELYRAFSDALSKTDFEGDSKIPVLPGWIRFTWNNVIVHATSIASAKAAEKIGLELFGNRLASFSRGVDARDPLNPVKTIDWPHYLCAEDPSKLPDDVFSFVQNK